MEGLIGYTMNLQVSGDKEALNVQIDVIKSKRKTFSLQAVSSEHFILRVPNRTTKKDISDVIERNREWIEKHALRKRQREIEEESIRTISEAELRELAESAAKVFKRKVEEYAPIVGVDYGRITIRNQRTRWGSCSSKGNLNLNVALMRAPVEVLDYVVVHELCHRLHMDHSTEFWKEVERVLPDYRASKKWLKENGSRLMKEIHG
jgi:Predicted metal-dependent hydrolase